jgi:hypothetical protein
VVEASAFPEGWDLELPPHPYDLPGRVLPGNAQEGISVSLRREGSSARANHRLLRYQSEQQAAKEYRRQQAGEFFSAGRLTPWEIPAGLSYNSPLANQYRLACADITAAHQFRVCIAMGQYGNYLSVFSTWVSPEFMTYADLERLLRGIDERMTHCLGKSLPTAIGKQ